MVDKGSCQRPWTKASCVADANDILYPQLTDENSRQEIAKKMKDEYGDLREQLVAHGEDKEHWSKDIESLVETYSDIFNDLGAGLLCSLVGKVLN